MTDKIIKQINTLDNLYCLDLIRRTIKAEIVIKSDWLDSDQLFNDLE
ncbi:hypothetical protein NG798_00990 [Ancylothrix sp. C2]|nr:hypothetical protein [Ancylothrix sp. D3o]MCT7948368.1 hypothetical protein [Ancylothrix sp. D3o]